MDRLTAYREAAREAVRTIADEIPSDDEVRTELVIDDTNGHYEVMQVGWVGNHRIHGILVHCDVSDGKVRIEHDGTDMGLADMLMAKGVPAQDIVLGWHPPSLRKYTPFAAV